LHRTARNALLRLRRIHCDDAIRIPRGCSDDIAEPRSAALAAVVNVNCGDRSESEAAAAQEM
jgi:hypothetical protein